MTVKNADEATRIAVSFLKKGYAFVQPIKASKKDSIWIVYADVGFSSKRIAEVKIDSQSGDVMEYNVPS